MILPPARLSASQTSTDKPLRANHQAEANPEIPPPTINTSSLSILSYRRLFFYWIDRIRLVGLELRLHFFEQIMPQQIAGIFSQCNKIANGIKTFVGFRIILEARHTLTGNLIGIEAQFLHAETLHALHSAHHGHVAETSQIAGSDALKPFLARIEFGGLLDACPVEVRRRQHARQGITS